MIRLLFLLIFTIIRLADATWYFKESKVCDPQSKNSIPFTGFKINRQYKIDGIIPNTMHFLSISHCNHGKVDYEKSFKMKSSDDIDWNKPFCMLKPKLGAQMTLKANDTVRNLKQNKDVGNEGVSGGQKHQPLINNKKTKNRTSSKFGKVRKGLETLIRNEFDNNMERITKGKFIQYTGKKTNEHLEDIRQADPQSSLEWESRNLICYKMARRRKYAKRNISFYMPHTFVGGLFECPIPKSKRKELFQSFSANEFLKTFDFACDGSIAKPISPLIAEDSTKQWFQTKLKSLSPSIIQTIPYLSTATPLNIRFAISDTPDMYMDTWATKIDVNEDYSYTDLDLHQISKAVALSAEYLNKIIKPIDINKLIDFKFRKTRFHRSENPALTEQDYFMNRVKNLSVDQKFNLVLASYSDGDEALHHINKLQMIWDNIFK